MSAGEVNGAGRSPGVDCEISQFWQNLQRSGQPEVPNESALLPGRKW